MNLIVKALQEGKEVAFSNYGDSGDLRVGKELHYAWHDEHENPIVLAFFEALGDDLIEMDKSDGAHTTFYKISESKKSGRGKT